MYDLLDEKEYVKLVQQRRNAEDFVVDDGINNYESSSSLIYLRESWLS